MATRSAAAPGPVGSTTPYTRGDRPQRSAPAGAAPNGTIIIRYAGAPGARSALPVPPAAGAGMHRLGRRQLLAAVVVAATAAVGGVAAPALAQRLGAYQARRRLDAMKAAQAAYEASTATTPEAVAAPTAAAAPPADARLASLLAGVEAPTGGAGVWPGRTGVVRLRLDPAPAGGPSAVVPVTAAGQVARPAGVGPLPTPTTLAGRRTAQATQRVTRAEIGALVAPRTAAEAGTLGRQMIESEYAQVEVVAAQGVTVLYLGAQAAATPTAGVAAPADPLIDRLGGWAVTLRAQPRGGLAPGASVTLGSDGLATPAPSARPVMELLVLDVRNGSLLVRPPAMPLGDLDAALRRTGRSPAIDLSRPLGFFGDPAP